LIDGLSGGSSASNTYMTTLIPTRPAMAAVSNFNEEPPRKDGLKIGVPAASACCLRDSADTAGGATPRPRSPPRSSHLPLVGRTAPTLAAFAVDGVPRIICPSNSSLSEVSDYDHGDVGALSDFGSASMDSSPVLGLGLGIGITGDSSLPLHSWRT
jgi:hypothetical protein